MTMPRVLETEAMDSHREAVDYDAMDHSEVNRVFADDFLRAWSRIALLDRALGGRADEPPLVLDLGTGTAQIPIEICRQYAGHPAADRFPYPADLGLRIMAADAAVHMLDLARVKVEVAGFSRQIRLDKVDAKRLPYPAGLFSAVISNSIVHHIPEPRDVLREAVRVTAPGGLIFFRDLLRPADPANVERLVAMYAAGANDHQRKMFGDSLRAALTLDEIRGLVVELGFDPSSLSQTTDRHWTWESAAPS